MLCNKGNDGQVLSFYQMHVGLTAIPNTVVNIGKMGLTTPYSVAVGYKWKMTNGPGVS